jgi:hypothetical protein
MLAVLMVPVMLAAVDAAPFGDRIDDADSVGLRWPEVRRIVRVEAEFTGPAPAADTMRVEYWHKAWTGQALRRYAETGAGSVGWAAADDWFNGAWKAADARVRVAGRTAAFTFAPSNEKEFPDLKTAGVLYRPALKIRVVFSGPHPRVAALRAITDSAWRNADLTIRFDQPGACKAALEVYNGQLQSSRVTESAGGCAIAASLTYASNPEDNEADRTLVTVRGARDTFSFAVDEAERGDRIYVKDFGALVTRSADPITIAEYRRILDELGAKTVYDRIAAHAEQTLMGAWNDMPVKPPYYFILGCEGARQRFRLEPNGELWLIHPSHARKRPGKDNARWLFPQTLRLGFGLPEGRFADRSLADGYLPIVTTRWLRGGVLYEQEAFADSLEPGVRPGEFLQGDDPTLAILRFRAVNTEAAPRTARFQFSAHSKAGPESLRIEGDRAMGSFENRPVLRYLVDTRGAGRITDAGYEVELAPHAEHTFFVKVPFVTLTEEREIAALRALSPEGRREGVARYWRERVASGTEIRTPEPWLNDFYKAHLTHLLINDEREPGADRYMARVGSFSYGAYGNESIMMISDMDRRGYFPEAARSLELFLHYQGSVPLPGNYRSQQGVLYGAGGYEAGGYNQHHGWILWGLAEHYWYTRDRAWMEHAAPGMLAACRWIAAERKATQKFDARGRPVPEYGLLPAGSLEDVTDFWFWLSTNSFTWWGLDNAARALRDFGHPEGAAMAAEAEAYRRDILAAYRGALERSPVMRLRDGAYVPHFPSNVYTRGRSYGWLRETLEGAIMLPVTRLLDPESREAEWVLKDYEDNLYVSDKYGYSIPVFDRFWFSRGGFSMQPDLLHGPLPYLYRDQVEHFLRAYFNAFASAFDPTLRMLCEHPLPELGYFIGDHFKSSDESQSAYWLRLMFAAEMGGDLWLGRGIPRYWLKDGERIGIRRAATHFGELSYEIRSEAAAGRITMTLDPPRRNAPGRIVVRFRHPESKPLRAVTVNGKPWSEFDSTKGDIRLPGSLSGPAEIVGQY